MDNEEFRETMLRIILQSMYKENLSRAQESVLAGEDKGNPTDLAREWTKKDVAIAIERFFEC